MVCDRRQCERFAPVQACEPTSRRPRGPSYTPDAGVIRGGYSVSAEPRIVRVWILREDWDALLRTNLRPPSVEYLGPDKVRTIDLVAERWKRWLVEARARRAIIVPADHRWAFRWTNAPPDLDRCQTRWCETLQPWRLVAITPALLDWQMDLYAATGHQVRTRRPDAQGDDECLDKSSEDEDEDSVSRIAS